MQPHQPSQDLKVQTVHHWQHHVKELGDITLHYTGPMDRRPLLKEMGPNGPPSLNFRIKMHIKQRLLFICELEKWLSVRSMVHIIEWVVVASPTPNNVRDNDDYDQAA